MQTRGGESLRWTVEKGSRIMQLVPAHCRQHRATDEVGEGVIAFLTRVGQLGFAEQLCGGRSRIRLCDVTDEPLPFEMFPFHDGQASVYIREYNAVQHA